MKRRLRTLWTSRRIEAAALVGGSFGLVDGLRAIDGMSTIPLPLRSLLTVALAIGLPGALAAAGLPVLWAFLGGRYGLPAGEAALEESGRSRLALALGLVTGWLFASAAGVLVLHGMRLALSASGSAFHVLRVLLALAIVLGAVAIGRRLLERPMSHGARRLAVGVVMASLAMSVSAIVAAHRPGLPARIDSGNSQSLRPAAWTSKPPPNVLFIVLDTTRADHLSAYGYPLPTSPYLEQLAREGTLYEHAIAPAPWTLPSHASMFTGLLPSTHQADEEHRWLAPEFTTLAERLLDSGYETVGFSSNEVVGRIYNLQQGFQHFYEIGRDMAQPPPDPIEDLTMIRLARRFVPGQIRTDKGAVEVDEYSHLWLDEWQKRPDRRPFFAYVNFLEAHLPYRPPPEYQKRFLDGPIHELIRPLTSAEFNHGAIYRLIGYKDLIGPSDYEQLRALYDASLAYQDDQLRILVEDLRSRGLLDDTLVIVVGDHGENLGEHGGLLGHAFSMHQTLLHVPLVIRHPAAFPAGLRHSGLVAIASLFATVLEAAGVKPDPAWPPAVGPLPRRLEGGAGSVVSEYDTPVFELYNLAEEARGVDIGPMLVRKRSIQDLAWKVVEPSIGTAELYHLANDPEELLTLAPSAEPIESARLLTSLHERLAAVPHPILAPVTKEAAIDPETVQSLKALGYMR